MSLSVIKPYSMTCQKEVDGVACEFTTRDQKLMDRHSCDVNGLYGGNCEDYPCCGHERGDCNGLLYGSDEAIKEQFYQQMRYEDGFYDEDEPDCQGHESPMGQTTYCDGSCV